MEEIIGKILSKFENKTPYSDWLLLAIAPQTEKHE